MAFGLVHRAHIVSDLLTVREKMVLSGLVEPHCKLIKSTVAQVLEARDTEGGRLGWRCLGCGVVCLVEDESVHSHFLRLYCVKAAKLLWEQELYIPFLYTAPCTFFHTFPADRCQVGLNFANETEAEEFHQEVKAVLTNQEKVTDMVEKPGDQQHAGRTESLEQPSPVDAPSPTDSPSSGSFPALDPVMRGLLAQARLTEEDLKDKDIAEAVDCIINKFGGLQAVQRELRKRDSEASLSAAGASVSPAPGKGPVPPVPSIKSSTTAARTPGDRESATAAPRAPGDRESATAAPRAPGDRESATAAPRAPGDRESATAAPQAAAAERNRDGAAFKHVGCAIGARGHDLILSALKDVFRQKQLDRDESSACGSQTGLEQ